MGQQFDPNINHTLLVLISKKFDAESIQQYRPINLCNVLYKVITNTIVIWLRQVMQTMVKQNQSSFISSQNISDNIIIAQEAIHTMKTRVRRDCWQ
ncbi:hypothetical protein J1N35_040291 [Gossypium stocksii]|uniref:Reverse transcriptase domain-containing protein n=1 Tax=Gossypium stocksii TaxID=47602 RepID=A0A9D3ZID7_9ROSI|nr:hypothetical protein J1N35_040291 [Gossypium stocksii]